MHFVVAWKFKAGAQRTEALTKELLAVFSGKKWVEVLENIFVVSAQSADDQINVRKQLVDLAKENPKEVNIMVSPPMSGGKYYGWLPTRLWPELNSISSGEED